MAAISVVVIEAPDRAFKLAGVADFDAQTGLKQAFEGHLRWIRDDASF
jgi:hypothetical protein